MLIEIKEIGTNAVSDVAIVTSGMQRRRYYFNDVNAWLDTGRACSICILKTPLCIIEVESEQVVRSLSSLSISLFTSVDITLDSQLSNYTHWNTYLLRANKRT